MRAAPRPHRNCEHSRRVAAPNKRSAKPRLFAYFSGYIKVHSRPTSHKGRIMKSASNSFLEEQRSKLKDIFWHLRWLGDLVEHDAENEGVTFLDFCRRNLTQSRSQAFQDLFVLYTLAEKKGGYFVEFGAADGVAMSNTVLMERGYGWNGIVAEPARIWHSSLNGNRACHIDTRCVYERSGETISFKEVGTGEISAIEALASRDGLADARMEGVVYPVDTIALHDLLAFHKAPPIIDYISIDTEGSEFAILNAFDFKRYDVKTITVEHNFVEEDRNRIHGLLSSKGFVRKFADLSGFDDWYVKV